MTRGRHSLAPRAARPRRFALLAAPLLTCGLVGTGIALAGHSSSNAPLAQATLSDVSAVVSARKETLSRSSERTTLARSQKARPKAVVVRRKAMTAKLMAPAIAGLSDAPCPDSSVEYRLTPGAVRLYRSVCHAFPQITQYGGWAVRGEHSSGKALDIMTSDVALGTSIAEFLQAHAAQLDLFDVIWRQHIWTPVRAGEGWRLMPDRGSATANHMNHVHVSVN